MKFLFSGIQSSWEMKLLKAAGVQHILVNPRYIPLAHSWQNQAVLDSNAYYNFVHNLTPNVEQYLDTVAQSNRKWLFVSMPDVIGSPELTWKNWQLSQQWLKTNYSYSPPPFSLIPIWQPGLSNAQFRTFLNTSFIVSLGGLVKRLRGYKSPNPLERKLANKTLHSLEILCEKYPQRLHLYGACWTKAISRLHSTLYSGDSSIWLRGSKYKSLFHIRKGQLIETYADSFTGDTKQLCIQNAKIIETYTTMNDKYQSSTFANSPHKITALDTQQGKLEKWLQENPNADIKEVKRMKRLLKLSLDEET